MEKKIRPLTKAQNRRLNKAIHWCRSQRLDIGNEPHWSLSWTNYAKTVKVKPSGLLRKFKKTVEKDQQKEKERSFKDLYG